MAPPRSRASVPANGQNRGPTALPTYQPPEHPLNGTAKSAFQNLPRDHKLDGLKNRLRAANNHLTQAAADINDRLQEKTAELEKRKKRRLVEDDSQVSHEEIDKTIDEMCQETEAMTENLEKGVRKIIDVGAEVEGMERALQELQADISNNRGYGSATQSTAGASQFHQSRSSRAVGSEDEGSDIEDGHTQSRQDNGGMLAALKQKITENKAAYQAMTMAHRYASHNDYIGFRKIVHDAHYPEDSAPPMPHASTWFTEGLDDASAPMTQGGGAAGDTIDDDDLAVASERISTKCPITLLPMKDPLTSRKCPHSFERAAILDMIKASDMTVGGSGRHGQKAMKCPVCEVLLTADDLKEDQVLIRKIRRISAALHAQNEESSDEEDGIRKGRPAGLRAETIGSSPATTRAPRFKNERQSQAPGTVSRQVSMVPNTQLQGPGDEEEERQNSSAVLDLEEEDEDMDE